MQIEADLKVGPNGAVQLKESDSYSLNLAPITVQLPGGERVPFLFTIKACIYHAKPCMFQTEE